MEKKEFWKVNKGELIMDGLLIIYSIFFSKLLFVNSDVLYEQSPVFGYLFFILLALFMPWYMGVIYARYRASYGRFLAAFPFAVMLLVMWVLISCLVKSSSELIATYDTGIKTKAVYVTSVCLILFYVIRSWYVGYKTEKDLLQGNTFDAEKEEHIRFFFISFGLSAAFVFCMMYFASEAPDFSKGFLFYFFIALLSMITGLALAFVMIKLLTRLQIIFPIVIISLLVCWSGIIEVSFENAFKLTGTTDYKSILITILVFTGVIPFRFVMLFAPPLRGINLLIGIIALICYFYSLGN